MFFRACATGSLCLLLTVPGAAQTRPAGAAGPAIGDDIAALARAWTLVSQGSYPAALAEAQELLRRSPRSSNALAVAVDAAIGRRGSAFGLDQYEQWLGSRTLEEPGILRSIARATLQEGAQNPATRLIALHGLASDGDERAAGELAAMASQGGETELRSLAAWGDQRAARALVTALGRRDVDPARTITAIGESGYREAIGAVAVWLEDQRPEVRGAAADALGRLGGDSPEVVALLTPFLADASSHVRTRAAAALYRLGEPAGTPWLQELAASSVPAGRLVAAEAMASRPDAAWMALVTELATTVGDPEVRLGAAKLAAPHNPELALSVARELSGDANPAIRELAGSVMSLIPSDEGLATLRRQLRTASDVTRLQAAARILALTR